MCFSKKKKMIEGYETANRILAEKLARVTDENIQLSNKVEILEAENVELKAAVEKAKKAAAKKETPKAETPKKPATKKTTTTKKAE